ncbi:helix-turn-helix domain-containing protein [Streptomyces bacillaris]|uniref:helix-turn-helix domain-containing protein n=1 Tax=Streptomyces bacillaris TaxID=68179 RepID=UPI0037F3036C
MPKAFKFALDPAPGQAENLTRQAGAVRWAFKNALGMKVAAHQQGCTQMQAPVDGGVPEKGARRRVRVNVAPPYPAGV